METKESSGGQNTFTQTKGDEVMYGYTLLLIIYIVALLFVGKHIFSKTWEEMDNDKDL